MSNTRNTKEYRLGNAAFQAALAGRWTAASRYVVRLSDECGGSGLHLALVAWCDTFLDHACDGPPPPDRFANPPAYIRTDTGQLDASGSARVPERIQWAGRLIQARANDDEAGWVALIRDMPNDGHEIGRYVSAVLEVTTRSINGLPRGFALEERRRAWADG